MPGPAVLLAADEALVDEGLRFNDLPPNYVAWLLIPLAIAAFVWFFYKREAAAPTWARIALATLRGLAIFFVVFLIFDPFRQFRKVEEVRSLVTVLVDGSASMARKDGYDQEDELADRVREAARLPSGADLREFDRSELVRRTLGPEGLRLMERLGEKHEVKAWVFSGGKPRPVGSLEEITNDGAVTATGDALAHVLSDPDIQAKPDASVVLISDGRANTGTNAADIARFAVENDKIPVHTVGVGDPAALRDLELRYILADEVALKGSTVKFELAVRNRGFREDWVTITIEDQDKRPWIPPQTRKITESDNDQILEIDLNAARVGTFTLEVTIQGPAGEEDVANNSRKHTLTVKDDRIRVLYVDTDPRWEYRRLKNFLIRGDQSFVTQCLLLSAEPSFAQERSPGVEPLRSFPATFEELDAYDVLILGDVNPTLLVPTPSRLEGVLRNIQRFVDNGGGLAVISGEGWMPAAYVDTPLEELLPVDITFSGDAGPMTEYVDEWKPRLSALGRRHPLTQVDADPEMNRRMWEQPGFVPLKEMRWWYPVRKTTPAAQVLAFHPTARNRFGPVPLLVTGNYGEGPVFFSAVDETWRWYYRTGPTYFNRYWGNVVRYLARAHLYRGSKRYKLVSNRSEFRQGESVQLTAFVKDRNFDPETRETQRIMVAAPESKSRLVEMSKRRDGEYVHTFKPTRFGRHEAWIVGDEGVAGPRYAPISFEVRYVDPERQDPTIDEAALKDIASSGGGSYFRLEQAEGLFERLRADTTRRSKVTPRPVRDWRWLPLVLLGLLTAEWLIRRRLNMA